jgi:hypothetical protein
LLSAIPCGDAEVVGGGGDRRCARHAERRALEVLGLDLSFFLERLRVEDLDERGHRDRREDGRAVGGDRRFVRLIGRDELVQHFARRRIDLVDGVVRVAEGDDGVILGVRGCAEDRTEQDESGQPDHAGDLRRQFYARDARTVTPVCSILWR